MSYIRLVDSPGRLGGSTLPDTAKIWVEVLGRVIESGIKYLDATSLYTIYQCIPQVTLY
jgi:hypothetical protein